MLVSDMAFWHVIIFSTKGSIINLDAHNSYCMLIVPYERGLNNNSTNTFIWITLIARTKKMYSTPNALITTINYYVLALGNY